MRRVLGVELQHTRPLLPGLSYFFPGKGRRDILCVYNADTRQLEGALNFAIRLGGLRPVTGHSVSVTRSRPSTVRTKCTRCEGASVVLSLTSRALSQHTVSFSLTSASRKTGHFHGSSFYTSFLP